MILDLENLSQFGEEFLPGQSRRMNFLFVMGLKNLSWSVHLTLLACSQEYNHSHKKQKETFRFL